MQRKFKRRVKSGGLKGGGEKTGDADEERIDGIVNDVSEDVDVDVDQQHEGDGNDDEDEDGDEWIRI